MAQAPPAARSACRMLWPAKTTPDECTGSPAACRASAVQVLQVRSPAVAGSGGVEHAARKESAVEANRCTMRDLERIPDEIR